MADPFVEHGLPVSGTYANIPLNPSTGAKYYATDQGVLYIYNDGTHGATGWAAITANTGSGLGVTAPLKLTDGHNSNGTSLAATASSGEFGISSTPGTSIVLLGEGAESATKTDAVIWEYTLPSNYVAGNNLTLTVEALYNVNSGTTISGKTLTVAAYLVSDTAGTQGSTIASSTGNPATLTTSAAAYTFTITGATLNPGNRIIIKLTTVLTEGGGTGSPTTQINSAKLS